LPISVVYASTDAMYLATSSWSDQVAEGQGSSPAAVTDIHGFSLADPTAPRYLGSGSVPGVLTDQYALSEYGGVLRVATTVGQAYAPVPGAASQDQQVAPAVGTSDNLVTVLQPSGGALVPIGQVSGLGRGERIYGVRFLGSLGYVVTFRQTDPLYVIDLSDPRHPALQGQLQLTGFSAYLHPLGGGRLLGLGQETDQGGDGVQVSVFDVSDPTHPALDARRYFGSSYSTAEHDPHQFLWWPGRGLAIIPVQQYAAGQSFTGDIVLRVNPDGSLTEVGRISQPAPPPRAEPSRPEPAQSGAAAASAAAPAPAAGGTMMAPNYGTGIERALIVGDLIYTVSDGGVMASDIDSLDQVAWMPFPSGQ
ncbi:MAG TPA: beta-propeller domain-containing protein, partial [Acidimicrobiales bacterium]|nr:beta-propeller domain-containing protein [Acidimicrobiales bacterium]